MELTPTRPAVVYVARLDLREQLAGRVILDVIPDGWAKSVVEPLTIGK